jgi:chromosome segregation ATPase
MTGTNGTSFGHLVDQLDRRLQRIETAIDRLADELDGKHEQLNTRIRQIENKHSEVKGGWTVLAVIGTVTGAVGSVAARWFGG